MFPCSVILEHCCDFPKGLEGQATFERVAAVSHLQRSLSSRLVMPVIVTSSRCGLLILPAMSCIISKTQSGILIPYSQTECT